MATDLPRPDITVTTGQDEGAYSPHTDVVISRDGKARSVRGEGTSEVERTKSIIEKVLGDHRNAEFIPRG